MVRFSGAGRSDVGLVRSNNEDSGFVGPTCLLVADGVGGAAAGEVASATAAYVVSASALSDPLTPPVTVLRDAVELAQRQVSDGVRQAPERTGMATTLTALVTDGARCGLAHVGDSRAYVLRDGDLVRVTRDHTFVQQLVDDSALSEAERHTHPWRHVVLRSVNGDAHETGDVTWLDLLPGDRVLLASDGLTDLVSEARIEAVLRRHDDESAADVLVEAALAAGGRDNVTVVVATVVDEAAPTTVAGTFLGAARDPRIVVDPAAVRLRTSA